MRAFSFLEFLMLGLTVGQEVLWAEMQNWQLFSDAPYLPDLLITIQTFLVSVVLCPLPNIPKMALIGVDLAIEIAMFIVYVVGILPENDPLKVTKIIILLILELAEMAVFVVQFKVHAVSEGESEIRDQARFLFSFSLVVFGAGFLYGFLPNFCPINSYNIGSVVWSQAVAGAIAFCILPVSLSPKGISPTGCLLVLLMLSMTVIFCMNVVNAKNVPIYPTDWNTGTQTGTAVDLPIEIASQFVSSLKLGDLMNNPSFKALYNSPGSATAFVQIGTGRTCRDLYFANDTLKVNRYTTCGDSYAVTPDDVMFCFSYSILTACCILILPCMACAVGILFALFSVCGCVVKEFGDAIFELHTISSSK